jgi:hypothetical protein
VTIETIAVTKPFMHPDKPGVSDELPLDAVIVRADLYPRIKKNPATVQKCAEDLDVLPPIEVNQKNELIDGRHRWTAHRKREAATIRITVMTTASDGELPELAIERNATHGLQLSQEGKRDMARQIHAATASKDRDKKKKHLARILSVSERAVREWLSRIDKDTKAARDQRIFDLWLACWTQEEIAEKEGCDQKTATNAISGETADLPDFLKSHPVASHLTDFEPPIYNIWKRQREPLQRVPAASCMQGPAMENAGGRCARCSKATEVHHYCRYPPWGTFDLPSDLMPVCHACHCELEGKDQ